MRKIKYFILIFIFSLSHQLVQCQSIYAEIDQVDYETIFHLSKKYNLNLDQDLSIQPIDLKKCLSAIEEEITSFSEEDEVLANSLLLRNNVFFKSNLDEGYEEESSPIFKYFFTNRQHFFSVDKEDLKLTIDPILNLSYGNATNDENIIFQNTRGIKAKALIDGKISIQTAIYENQARFMPHVERLIAKDFVIPGNGLYKNYNSKLSDRLTGWDYLNAQGHINVPISKSINFQLGHGQHKIGHGYRSLFLSDFSNNYFYGKLDAKLWKFHYQTIYSELNVLSVRKFASQFGDKLLPKKYSVMHFLSFRPNQKFDIGIFEGVVFGRANYLELQYLNPVILYRAVEGFLGSPDNAMIGINTSYTPHHSLQLYSQLMLDELNFDIISENRTWWGNKYGLQAGINSVEPLGIKKLNMRVEYNLVRPYTYSHFQGSDTIPDGVSVNSYSHYGMPMAHALGANFREFLVSAHYKLSSKLSVNSMFISYVKGLDTNDGKSYGGDILKSYLNRPSEYDVKIGQGLKDNVRLARASISYEFFPNAFVDFDAMYRSSTINNSSTYLGINFRLNAAKTRFDF